MLELSLHILDIVENSTRAGARKVSIDIIEDKERDLLSIEIRDDGSGMNENTLNKVLDPFFTTKTVRNVGLGLPMLAHASESAGGRLVIESVAGGGTRVLAEFQLSHIDRQPLGNMASTLTTLVAGNADVDFLYRHRHNERQYIMDTRAIKKTINNLQLENLNALTFIKQHIEGGLEHIGSEA